MEAGGSSDGENPSRSGAKAAVNSGEGTGNSKPKRLMKTPFQLETLEKTYALETYPTEATRVDLAEKLGLTDRQLQMWFCHRRLKEKKETPNKKVRKETSLREFPVEELRAAAPEHRDEYRSGSGSGSSLFTDLKKAVLDDFPFPTRRHSGSSSQSIMERRAIACVESQLEEPLREDGPILGIEFDPLPPGAFATPIGPMHEQHKQMSYSLESNVYERQDATSNKASARALHEYQFLQDHPNVRSDGYPFAGQSPYQDLPVDTLRARTPPFLHGDEHLARVNGVKGQISRVRHLPQQDKKAQFSSPYGDDSAVLQRDLLKDNMLSIQASDVFPETQIYHGDMEFQMDRKRKTDEARAKEVEAHELRMRKELERQDILRRKNEERVRKEMERLDRERRKEEERLLRERQREEEKLQREQRRELERREKFLQKEYIRAEKMKQKEELRREREAEKSKVAREKATARKIAKEASDLIEDEQLELMELVAASKGLHSIAHFDYNALQNLDSFRDSLCLFPPDSVELEKPLAIEPWADSEENIGNLLMVFKFFLTFADILGLWPFTLEEFVQALHDHDSRLLGELHISLLRLIIKDIEDVARTPTGGLGTNQYSASNPEGGHPKIVEGAYMWGFDIRNWQRHLSPLTWPEIFRQLALAAGYGPHLKKRNSAWTYLGDNGNGKGCEDTISILRNGSAAENAFALMREKGLLAPRKSRHRLTPGTVKFAAFHVLSLEGSKGLTVLELADKIQKSGLRDLTTSRTPEASISVALTRDQKLFERIAPSTYCLREAYRKDPEDAETILSSARKKIRMFENGVAFEDADYAERDEESDGDVDEDPEIDDLAAPLSVNKSIAQPDKMDTSLEPRNDNTCCNLSTMMHSDAGNGLAEALDIEVKDDTIPGSVVLKVAKNDVGVSVVDPDDMEVDESKEGESWIEGLTEDDYTHLSVEERLNALVILVGLANEGNTMRSTLEDRLEAANALKKQMWTEAQLDRSRLKEEFTKLDFMPSVGSKPELQVAHSGMAVVQRASPFVDINKEASPSTCENHKLFLSAQDTHHQPDGLSAERALADQEASMIPDNVLSQHPGFTSKRSRSLLKAYIGHKAEEVYVYRSLPLGQDRRRNRYWQFVASASANDPCADTIFVELKNGTWRVIDSSEAFGTLLFSLDHRGLRESNLRIMLRKIETTFKTANAKRTVHSKSKGFPGGKDFIETDASSNRSIDSPSSMACGSSSVASVPSSLFRIQLDKNDKEKMAAWERYVDLQKWVRKRCFNPSILSSMNYGKKRSSPLLATCEPCLESYLSEDTHCNICHQTFSVADEKHNFSRHVSFCEEQIKSCGLNMTNSLPLGIKLLKALLSIIEAAVPLEALESCWTENFRRSWGIELNKAKSIEEILQVLTVFESAIRQDSLSPTFETTKELLMEVQNVRTTASSRLNGSVFPELVHVLPWIPKTTAAVGLRLLELESAITYAPHEKAESFDDKPLKLYMKFPSRYSSLESKEEQLRVDQDDYVKEHKLSQMRNRRTNNKRGRTTRGRGFTKRSQKKTPVSRSDGKRNKEVVNLDQGLRQQGGRMNGQGRGPRTVRKRRSEKMGGESSLLGGMLGPKSFGSMRTMDEGEEWVNEKAEVEMEAAENSNSEAADSEENVDVEDDEHGNWDQELHATPNGWNESPIQASDDEGDDFGDDKAYGDENPVQDVRIEESDEDMGMSDNSDEVASQMGNEGGSDTEVSDDYSD